MKLHNLGVLIGILCAGFSGRAQPGTEAPKVLPQVDVFANVPLEKVGDFKMREARFGPAAVVDGDFIYIIGGQDTARGAMDSIERFNVRTGQSEDFAKLKTGRFWHRAVVADGKIYVLGGVNGRTSGTPDAMFQAPQGDLLAGRRVASGSSNPERVSDSFEMIESSVEVIDLATREVSAGVPMPDARQQFACVVLDEKIYVLGGVRPSTRGFVNTNDTQVFDLKRGKWSRGVALPAPGSFAATVVAPGVIVVAGGFDGDRALDAVEVFNPADKIWRILPPLHRGVSAHSLVFLGHYLFLFGDYLSPDELVAYDLIPKRSEAFTLDYKRARHTAAVLHEGKAYVIGGRAVRDTESVDYIQVYALRNKK
jgi:hypothetical protein